MSFQKYRTLALILLLGLIHGLLYIAITPLWEHYDEPGNFEYAWLLAHRPGMTHWGDYDPDMRRAVLSSMIASHFFDQRGFQFQQPSLNKNPAWIGETQVGDSPLYYWIASLPMRIMPEMAIRRQLYAGRMVSLLMYLVTILAAWGIMAELFPNGNALCWMVPATLALLPGLTDIMTAVNNDVGAVLFYTLWLWVSIRMLRHGPTILRLMVFMLLAAACIFTKKSVYLILITAPLGFVLILVKGRWQILAWSILGLAGIVIGWQLLSWDDVAMWYRSTGQSLSGRALVTTQVKNNLAIGDHAIQVELNPGVSGFSPAFSQVLPDITRKSLQGKAITVAGWMWASAVVQTTTPALNVFDLWPSTNHQVMEKPIKLSTTPQFFATQYQIPDNIELMVLSLAPKSARAQTGSTKIFYTNLMMVEGVYPADQIPQFTDSQRIKGTWGGQQFLNLVSNASSDEIWPRWNGKLYSFIISKLSGYDPNNVYGLIPYILDLPRYNNFALLTADNLFRTFWAKLSWGEVTLIPQKSYWLLLIATLVGGAGCLTAIIRRWRRVPWKIVIFLFVVGGLSWLYDFLIGIVVRPLIEPGFITAARYAAPAIVPTALLLNVGWWEAGNLIKKFIPQGLKLPPLTGQIIYCGLFICLDILALSSLYQFYRKF